MLGRRTAGLLFGGSVLSESLGIECAPAVLGNAFAQVACSGPWTGFLNPWVQGRRKGIVCQQGGPCRLPCCEWGAVLAIDTCSTAVSSRMVPERKPPLVLVITSRSPRKR